LKSLAYKVYRNWRKEFERKIELSKNKIEVEFDQETSDRVKSCVALLLPILGRRHLCEQVEKEVRKLCGGLVGSDYRKAVRCLVFGLRREEGLRKVEQFKEGVLSAKELVHKLKD